MNKGKIKIIRFDEFIIELDSHTTNGYKVEQYEIHPSFASVKWIQNQEVDFVLCTECSKHYPTACQCYLRELYAFPILKKQKKSLINKLKNLFKKLKK